MGYITCEFSFRRQEAINLAKEDIEKLKKSLTKKKPPKNTDFVKPGDKPYVFTAQLVIPTLLGF